MNKQTEYQINKMFRHLNECINAGKEVINNKQSFEENIDRGPFLFSMISIVGGLEVLLESIVNELRGVE